MVGTTQSYEYINNKCADLKIKLISTKEEFKKNYKTTRVGYLKFKISCGCIKEATWENMTSFLDYGKNLEKKCRTCQTQERRNKKEKLSEKKCTRCHQVKSTANFMKVIKDGNFTHWSSWCFDCVKKDPNLKKFRKKRKKKLNTDLESRLEEVLYHSEQRVKHKKRFQNTPYDITKEWMKELWNRQNGKSAISGRPLSIVSGDPNLVSLDRIVSDTNKGGYYIKTNTQLITDFENRMKLNQPEEIFFKIIEDIHYHQKKLKREEKNKTRKILEELLQVK